MFSFKLYFILIQIFFANEIWSSGIAAALENCEKCVTDQCVAEGNYYLSNMDTNVDPCEDFYQFACGNFIKKNANLPSNVPFVNALSNVQNAVNKEILEQVKEDVLPNDLDAFKKIKIYFQSCMNTTRIEEDGINPLLGLLKSLGGWPMVIGSNWDESKFDLINSLYRLRKKNYPITFPFGLEVARDLEDSSKSILAMKPPQLGINPAFFASDSKLPEAYFNFIKNAAVLLGAGESRISQEILEIQTFESRIFEALATLLDSPRHMTLKDLSTNITSIPWSALFNIILSPSRIQIDQGEKILVPNLKFVTKVAELIHETPKRTIANYLGWSIVHNTMPYLPHQLNSLLMDFLNIQLGTSGEHPRELLCIENVKAKLSIGVSSMYVKKYFNKQIKTDAQEMFEAIKDQMRKNLEEVDWMDEGTKRQALDKLEAMRTNIAYADELLDDEKINEYYSKLDISPGNLISNAMKVSVFDVNKMYRNLRFKQDKYSWKAMLSSTVANAYYQPQLNLVDVSAGFLRGSVYQYNRPQYLNYGSMGTIIGHEITHAFDNIGRNFDKDGNLRNWWNSATEQKFLEKTKCIIEQYNNFTVRDVNLPVNGERTQGENIADNGGTKAAYLAYNEWANSHDRTTETCLPQLANYTPQQMFWISAASNSCTAQRREFLSHSIATDTHSPSAARVIVTFSNIPEFARDFQCKVGSRMNPEKRCVVW